MAITAGEILALTTDREKETVRFNYVYGVSGNNVHMYSVGSTNNEKPTIDRALISIDGEIITLEGVQVRFKDAVYRATSVSYNSMPPEFIPRYFVLRSL